MRPRGQTTLQVVVDAVIFTLQDRDLKVCLVQQSSSPASPQWGLPGDMLSDGELLDRAALRLIHSTLSVRDVYLQQLYTFDAHDRAAHTRAVSVAYFALISADKLARTPSRDEAAWHSVYRLPPLMYDHSEILDYALTRLRYKIEYSAVAFELLPQEFTLRELQDAYMIILNDFKLDKANFRKKIRDANILEEISGYRETGGRPARLYQFRQDAQLETKARRFFP
jgi:8-oxo-dGTP diphosphatase